MDKASGGGTIAVSGDDVSRLRVMLQLPTKGARYQLAQRAHLEARAALAKSQAALGAAVVVNFNAGDRTETRAAVRAAEFVVAPLLATERAARAACDQHRAEYAEKAVASIVEGGNVARALVAEMVDQLGSIVDSLADCYVALSLVGASPPRAVAAAPLLRAAVLDMRRALS